MLSACYLNNRTWHHSAEGVPITLVTGNVPNLSHLKIFGCPTFVHIPAGQRKKMSYTVFTGILVGYPTDTYGYLVYNPRTRKVITTRHIRFDETFNGRLSEDGKMPPTTNIKSIQPPAPTIYTSSDNDKQPTFPVDTTQAPQQHNQSAPTSPRKPLEKERYSSDDLNPALPANGK